MEVTWVDDIVLQAIEAARASVGKDRWEELRPRDWAQMIYREMRRIDAETAQKSAATQKPPRGGWMEL
jgi:hypothetical protein